jgi:hypothetical protein
MVSITPEEVYRIVGSWDGADLLHQELKDLGDQKWYAALVFEKYFFRNKSRAGLVVLCDNVSGDTEVRLIATGTGDGLFFSFDWGAGDDFIDSVAELLSDYWVADTDQA